MEEKTLTLSKEDRVLLREALETLVIDDDFVPEREDLLWDLFDRLR